MVYKIDLPVMSIQQKPEEHFKVVTNVDYMKF